MNTSFVHLHVHTEYSLLDGAARIEALADKAAALGMTALAITDHANLYGAIPFYKACRIRGIKPILGLEVYLIDGDVKERVLRGTPAPFHLVLLAENEQGYKNLMALSTLAQTVGHQVLPRINKQMLRKHAAGLIATSGCREGEIARHLLAQDVEAAKASARWYQETFGVDRFYLELQDHGLEIERRLNQRMMQLHRETGIPLVVTNNVHYLEKADYELHDCLLAIGSGKTIEDKERLRYETDQYYLKSGAEMAELFAYAPEAIENTRKIAERCHVEITFGQHILPRFPLPDGVDADRYLRELCEKGCEQRYGVLSPQVVERLDYELSVITSTGFTDYFLIVWDFMRFAHENGIPTGPGRGSAAGSLVAYALRITNVDPLAYHLLFERFLNRERVTMPDIDIDFSVERRDEVIRYVADKYGHDRVAQIITFGTLAARAAVRDVGRALGVSLGAVDQLAKMIPQGMTIDKAIQFNPAIKASCEENKNIGRCVEIAKGLEGLPRHASTHAAGVVISREPLLEYVPLQTGSEGLALTQYSMEILEEVGLLKMDFLGLRNLTIIQDALLQMESQGITLLLDALPDGDAKTFAMLARGDTTGVFQLESTGMRNVLRELKPSRLDDIVAVLALYRPGPMEIIPQYISAKHGQKAVEYAHPVLEPILKETHGFILYQEQIMQISSAMAGFSLGEADILRRAVGKKKRELLAEQREKFVVGSVRMGYTEELAQQIYDLIVRFADYGFNKAHAVAYAVIAYQMAYLKANYPLAFMAALLSHSIGSQHRIAEYTEEAKRLKVAVLPPDVNFSDALFAVEGEGIRFGLAAVKNVGYGAIDSIVRERKKALFTDIVDFCSRVDQRLVNRRVLESLILSGAMDSLPGHRAQLLTYLDEALDKGATKRKAREESQLNLFHLEDDGAASAMPVSGSHSVDEINLSYPDVPPFSQMQQLNEERELLGVYLSGHPLDEYTYVTNRPEVVSINGLSELRKDSVVKLAGMVTEAKRIQTKKGDPMAFLTLEDKTAQVELVVFPNVFAKAADLLYKESLLVVEGRLDIQEDVPKIIASRVWDLKALPKPVAEPVLLVKISPRQEHDSTLPMLQQLFNEKKGAIPVILYYESKKQSLRLSDAFRVEHSEEFLEQVRKIVGTENVLYKELPKNEF